MGFDVLLLTNHSSTFDKTGSENKIHLQSGISLEPDIIVVATGLSLDFAGGMKISVDSRPVDASQKYAYRSCMIQDVPNLIYVIGYAHAAWTLGAEVTAIIVGRLLNRMRKKGANIVVPVIRSGKLMPIKPLLPLTSTYLKTPCALRVQGFRPHQASLTPITDR